MVRQHLKKMIPEDHPLYTAWLQQSEIPAKCFMKMKIEELYRDVNVIQCTINPKNWYTCLLTTILLVYLPQCSKPDFVQTTAKFPA
jgi:hypothetical protein